MNADDMTLLDAYVRDDDQEAFGTLVSRHVNLVYAVALRQVGEPHLAEEVAQVVFIILARKAGSLGPKTILPGWLCRTARYASANALTVQRRRQRREQEVCMHAHSPEPEPNAWSQMMPLLDSAMAQLGAKDHDALVLRYLKGGSLQEVGSALGVSPEAAKKRVSRGLEKLRKYFARRSVALSVTVIAATLATHSAQAAPAALAGAITPLALAKGLALSGTTGTLLQGVLKLMTWTKVKTVAVIGIAVLAAGGTSTLVVKQRVKPALAMELDGQPVKVVARFDWQKLAEQGRLPGGEVVKESGRAVLKLGNSKGGPLSLLLLKVREPSIRAMHYALTGEIKYAGVEQDGHLAMWSFFPAAQPGQPEPQYYSYTGGAEPGPGAKIMGDSDWRVFSLPLDRTAATYPSSFSPAMDTAVTARPPTRLELSVFLPGAGVVYLRDLKLVEWENPTQVSAK